jgi:DegV family protein with EDD domain
MRIRVVTDSSTNVPEAELARLNIAEVPAIVNFGAESFLNKVEISTEEFYRRLAAAEKLPTTAQPTPQQFAQAYARLAAEGADEIIAVTVSSKLSGTLSSAVLAAEHAAVKVHLWDSLSASIGGGLQAIAAAEMVRDGLASAELLQRLAGIRKRMQTATTPATLRYLVASGRAPKLQSSIGELLDIKPILAVIDGLLEPVSKARGRRRALQAMLDLVAGTVGDLPARVAVAHANVADEAREFLQAVKARIRTTEPLLTELGPVLATLAGPGLIALAAYTLEEPNA